MLLKMNHQNTLVKSLKLYCMKVSHIASLCSPSSELVKAAKLYLGAVSSYHTKHVLLFFGKDVADLEDQYISTLAEVEKWEHSFLAQLTSSSFLYLSQSTFELSVIHTYLHGEQPLKEYCQPLWYAQYNQLVVGRRSFDWNSKLHQWYPSRVCQCHFDLVRNSQKVHIPRPLQVFQEIWMFEKTVDEPVGVQSVCYIEHFAQSTSQPAVRRRKVF